MSTQDIRTRFPIFSVHPDLIYLDNAATTQRPEEVIQAMDEYYRSGNANIHRGVYDLSAKSTEQYESVRDKVADFIGAESGMNIGFTRGTTESINIVARSFLSPILTSENNVVVSIAEHHANFIPWQQVAAESGAELRIVPMDASGQLDLESMRSMIDARTGMVAVTHISNTLGSIFPIDAIINMAHKKGVPVMLDAAQSAALYPLNVSERKIDFLAFSGHKIFGPYGTGILYASDEYRNQIRPYNVGGGMIRQVAIERTDFQSFPISLEAGTPNIAGVIGLGAALDFLGTIDRESTLGEIDSIAAKVKKELAELPGVNIAGPFKDVSSII
ncbi:MAG: aminotransferase class V-fold PLP-dependent enzyme, partial [Cyclobacteriaceae bacterium]